MPFIFKNKKNVSIKIRGGIYNKNIIPYHIITYHYLYILNFCNGTILIDNYIVPIIYSMVLIIILIISNIL